MNSSTGITEIIDVEYSTGSEVIDVGFIETTSTIDVIEESSELVTPDFTPVVVVKEEVPTEGGTTDHNELENRNLPNQHTIESITGLKESLENKQPKGNYLTEHQSLEEYAKKIEIPNTLPASDVYAWAKEQLKPTYTAEEVGADSAGSASKALEDSKKYTDQQISNIPTPDVSGQINTHNTNTEAHNDIRLFIQDLASRLNTLADSDDETLDQMSEFVEYVKANRELIESITISKVSVKDIIDNLSTNVGDKPLSAAQGVALKALIDAIKVPTKVSELKNDSEFINQEGVEEIVSQTIENGDFKGEDGKAGIVISETEPIPYEDGEYPVWLNPEGEQTDSLATMQNIEDVRKEIPSLEGYAKKSELPSVPTKLSAFDNDAGYLKLADIVGTQKTIKVEIVMLKDVLLTKGELLENQIITFPTQYCSADNYICKFLISSWPKQTWDNAFVFNVHSDCTTVIGTPGTLFSYNQFGLATMATQKYDLIAQFLYYDN